MQITNLKNRLRITIVLLAALCTAAVGKTIYVDDDATGANDGSSWVDAYNYLQDALADANSAEKPVEIRVAQGIYKPDLGAGNTPGDREATFQLINDVILKGGFAGIGAEPDVRDVEAYETILSGDLNGDDVEVANPEDLRNEPTRAENSYCVVTSSRTYETAVLDGLVIAGGNAESGSGGMYNYKSNPTLANCTFTGNSAMNGGGMYNFHNSNPTLTNCTFSGNWAICGGGMDNGRESNPILTNCTFSGNLSEEGGGMHNWKSSPTLTNCTFSGNSTEWGGGGMLNSENSNPSLTNCTFSGNSAERDGGGMHNWFNSNPTLTNCTFSGNSAKDSGGGMYNWSSSSTLTNCTFAQNSAQNENALGCDSYKYSSNHLKLINCILWDNGNEIYNHDNSTIMINYNNIQGGFPGEGNIDVDPLFADPGYWADVNNTDIVVDPNDPNAVWVDGDYHLKSEAGRWDSNSQSWVQDDLTSPCIDAGDPMSPIGHEPFPNGGIVNMGAYGGTVEASKSYFGEPICETIVAGDINGDCKVDFSDFAIMALHWLEDNYP